MTDPSTPAGGSDLPAAAALYVTLTALDRRLDTIARKAWALLHPAALQESFIDAFMPAIAPELVDTQLVAAEAGAAHISAAGGTAKVAPQAFAGYFPSGETLSTGLVRPVVTAMTRIAAGMPRDRVMVDAYDLMEERLVTVVHDTGRQAVQVAIAADGQWTGYQRFIEPGACSRCIILAGRIYRWSHGFRRHPKCRCYHVAVSGATAPPQDPQAYFDNLSESEQNRVFTNAGAQAIRDGADMNRVVNSRLGMSTVTVGGEKIKTTTVGTGKGQRKGPRLLPEEIYKQSHGDRIEAVRLLHSNGYLLAA